MDNEMLSAASGFRRHGIPVQADEGRTATICTNRLGDTRLVIAARSYVLIVHPWERTCKQLFFPANNKEYPYASLGSSRGMFVLGAGTMLMVIDPFSGRVVDWCEAGQPGEAVGFSLAEQTDGTIYAASYPTCRLLQYAPDTQTWTDLGLLDEKEDYPFHLAVDQDGWVYVGIGTEQCIVAARNPLNGEVRPLLVGKEGESGKGTVRLGADGDVYGQLVPSGRSGSQQWYRLRWGAAVPVSDHEVADSAYTGTGFQTVHGLFPPPLQLLQHRLQDKQAIVRNDSSGEEWTIPLAYESEGADLSPIAAGPDGIIYGTSNHPLHWYTYNPVTGGLYSFGGGWIEGNGNICAYAVQGRWIAGAAYAGGHVHLFDTTRPYQKESGEANNPVCVASVPEIYRPRCALAHPDGAHVIFGGYGNYGVVGGGLYIRNLLDHSEQVLTPERLVPYHSTMCIVPLPNGDLLCGTSVEAPGGGKARDEEGRLYRLNWQTKEVLYSDIPISGAREIALMEIDDAGIVHAFTHTCYFVYDPQTRQVLAQQDLSGWGALVRQGLVKDGDGTIFGVRGNAVFRVDPDARRLIRLWEPPYTITAGLALHNNRLYVACGKQLCSVPLYVQQGAIS